MKKEIALGILFLFFVFLFPKSAFASTYYVAGDTGSDLYTSVQAQNTSTPWKTIQKAADNVTAGDTVNVKGGVSYTNTNNFSCNL